MKVLQKVLQYFQRIAKIIPKCQKYYKKYCKIMKVLQYLMKNFESFTISIAKLKMYYNTYCKSQSIAVITAKFQKYC